MVQHDHLRANRLSLHPATAWNLLVRSVGFPSGAPHLPRACGRGDPRSLPKHLVFLDRTDNFRRTSFCQTKMAPRLLAAFGSDRGRFEFAAEMQQLAGIAPVTEKSGTGIWIHWRLARSKFLRQTFQEFAACSILQSDWARAFYDQLRKRGKSHHAALRALAFKWVRIIFRCWKTRTPYDETVYCNSLKLRRSPLAAELPADEKLALT